MNCHGFWVRKRSRLLWCQGPKSRCHRAADGQNLLQIGIVMIQAAMYLDQFLRTCIFISHFFGILLLQFFGLFYSPLLDHMQKYHTPLAQLLTQLLRVYRNRRHSNQRVTAAVLQSPEVAFRWDFCCRFLSRVCGEYHQMDIMTIEYIRIYSKIYQQLS